MPENKTDGGQSIAFESIKIGLASPEKIREWSEALSQRLKQLTTER